jgi:hypothetical protein
MEMVRKGTIHSQNILSSNEADTTYSEPTLRNMDSKTVNENYCFSLAHVTEQNLHNRFGQERLDATQYVPIM